MSQFTPKRRPVVLCILDGWGLGDGGEMDGIASADTPHFDALMREYPNTTLTTFGNAVGLPEGQMGNSEVGHMNIGAGRVAMQYLPRIDKAFADGTMQDNAQINAFAASLKASGKACHLMGLVSDGGVHAHIDHVVQSAILLAEKGVRVYIHAFTDGRDCAPQSGKAFIADLEKQTASYNNITLATLCGRYYAMDRDNRWERVQQAYDVVINAKGEAASSACDAIQASYDSGKTDEFITPIVLNDYQGFEDGDAVLFANFRNDRAREILDAMLSDDFDGFDRAPRDISHALGMVQYSEKLNAKMGVLFPPLTYDNALGEVISKHGLTQVRLAETEKYPHVTFFFNCGREDPWAGEERILVSSPKVATYDLQPEMSAPEVSAKLLAAVNSDQYDVVIVNFANTDMVGHTGIPDAIRKSAAAVDEAVGKLRDAVLEKGGVLLVTADHGNADQMYDATTHGPHTAHTLNPVPFIVVGADVKLKDGGKLADIAPTMLSFLGIDKPAEMDGDVLCFLMRV